MTKIILFWLLGVLTVGIILGGGTWLFFTLFDKAKKRKLI